MKERANNNGVAPSPLSPRIRIWRTAVLRPAVATYRNWAEITNVGLYEAWVWLLASGFVSGLVMSGVFLAESALTLYRGLLFTIPIFAVNAVFVWALFAGFTHAIARLLRGTGSYAKLIYLFATFSAPLMLITSVLSLVLHDSILNLALYGYWVVLYIIATQAVYQLSRLKAIFSVFGGLCLSGVLLFGIVFFGILWWV